MRTPLTTGPSRSIGSREDASPKVDASTSKRGVKLPKVKPPCFRDPVTIVHFREEDSFPLTKCDGTVAPLALERLSILARPQSAAKPNVDPIVLAQTSGDKLAPGIRRIDPLLVERMQSMVSHFAKDRTAKQARIFLVSGYRPSSKGSFHASGDALDFRIDGVRNEALVAFCKTLPDTGCGYYPNSSFIHMDVRRPGTGHVAWIDASGPGESARYVSAWPPPAGQARSLPTAAERAFSSVEDALAKLDRALPPFTTDDHPAEVARRPVDTDAGVPEVSPLDLPAAAASAAGIDDDENARAARPEAEPAEPRGDDPT